MNNWLPHQTAASVFLKRNQSTARTDRCEEHSARELQFLNDYLVRETGGQMYYKGRDMAVGPTEGGEVMAFLDSLKADIVTA